MKLAITGAAMTTSVGRDKHATYEALVAGRSSLKALAGFDATRFNVPHAHEIADRPAAGGDIPMRATRWLVRVVTDAVREAGLDLESQRVVAVVGTGLRELRSLELWGLGEADVSLDRLHFGNALNAALGVDVPVYTISNACSASTYALAMAEDLLALGEVDAVIVAGTDTITASMFGLLDRVTNNKPLAVRPFEKARAGTIMGDGAAAIVVEREEDAVLRRQRVLARVLGVAVSCDAYHETAPKTVGIEKTMRDAQARAGVGPADIDVVLAHGTGTLLNDKAEAEAASRLFGGRDTPVDVTAIKSMTGHNSGASGLVSLVSALGAMQRGVLPPTLGLDEPIAEAQQLNVLTTAKRKDVDIAQINAFGFGGVNAVVILQRSAS